MRIAALICLLWASAASAQSPAEAAATAADRLSVASALLEVASTKRDRVAALTETVSAYETGLAALRDGLRRAAIRQRTIEADLSSRSAEVGQLLGALQSIGRAPAPLLLLHPSGALGTARGGMIAAEVTPALNKEVQALRAQLEEVAALHAIQEGALDTLTDGLRGAQEARTRLSTAISERTDLPQRFSEDPVQTALLLSSTETLGAFATSLSDAYLTDSDTPLAASPDSTLPLPVQGQVLRRFGETDAAGVTRPGLVIATRPQAMVVTPTPATILFLGPLLDYGNVVIIEPAPDTMFVLAGLSQIFGEPGQVVPAGTPLGLMGGEMPRVDAILTEWDSQQTDAASQTLYLEVRDGQSPVDPATWFALDR